MKIFNTFIAFWSLLVVKAFKTHHRSNSFKNSLINFRCIIETCSSTRVPSKFKASVRAPHIHLFASESDLESVAKTSDIGTADQTDTEAPRRPEISNSMREKLRAELRSQGADPNYSAGPILGNPILLISIVVALLVLFGGKDIFF